MYYPSARICQKTCGKLWSQLEEGSVVWWDNIKLLTQTTHYQRASEVSRSLFSISVNSKKLFKKKKKSKRLNTFYKHYTLEAIMCLFRHPGTHFLESSSSLCFCFLCLPAQLLSIHLHHTDSNLTKKQKLLLCFHCIASDNIIKYILYVLDFHSSHPDSFQLRDPATLSFSNWMWCWWRCSTI